MTFFVLDSPTIDELNTMIEEHGKDVIVRSQQTRELLYPTVRFPIGYFPARQGMSRRLIIAESLSIIAGIWDLDLIVQATPKANRILFTEQMAYGPRLKIPLVNVIRTLSLDQFSRRAIAHISRPEDACGPNTPCTTMLQFFIREDQLHMDVHMRSWDLVFGLPVDIAVFGIIGQVIASCFQVKPGSMMIHAGSLHRYAETTHLATTHQETNGFGQTSINSISFDQLNPSPLTIWNIYQGIVFQAIADIKNHNRWKTLVSAEFILKTDQVVENV